MEQHVLVGKILTGIQIAEDKGAIRCAIDGGEIIARADGDCCSHSWIESVELPALGFPCLVTAVSDLDMPEQPYDTNEHECLRFYGCKISTDKGDIVIDYRNSSNGYYGGNLCWPDDGYFYGGVYGQNVSKEKWQDIK